MAQVASRPKSRSGASGMDTQRVNRPFNERSLRKLPRTQLQKLAKERGMRANVKSEQIIQTLLKPEHTKKNARPADDDHEQGPPKKKGGHTRIAPEQLLPAPESQFVPLGAEVAHRPQMQRAVDSGVVTPSHVTKDWPDPFHPVVSPHDEVSTGLPQQQTVDPSSQPLATTVEAVSPTDPVLDPDLFSDTDSEMTDITQPSYATPRSSRACTPLPSEVHQVQRAVDIMQHISRNDQTMIAEIARLRETAAQLRKQTQDIRDVVHCEQGRRERMEAYFTYWNKIEGTWPRKWLYGEAMVPAKYLRPAGRDEIIGPPTLAPRRRAQKLGSKRDDEATAARTKKQTAPSEAQPPSASATEATGTC
ncbi:hypothetical protein EDC04DRAFT_2906390 [Pisolithus marmoratus]|nr:hypothetical protein EDC04DRAFT_2906390 [Pisolithus marmoratus]